MLTGITIQNFKGIGDPVTIPIRPLTIMFGKNSAGKSTVVQALHYAREVLINNNPDADRTSLGGDSIDLGGFRNLVHNRDLSRPIRIQIDTDIDDFGMPDYGDFNSSVYIENLVEGGFSSEDAAFDLQDVQRFRAIYAGDSFESVMLEAANKGDKKATSMSVAFTVEWSETLQRPVVTRYETTLAGDPAARIITAIDQKDIVYEINLTNRMLFSLNGEELGEAGSVKPEWVSDLIFTSKASLPIWKQGVSLNLQGLRYGDVQIGAETVSEMLVAPGEVAVFYLERFRYVGPMRDVPPRNFEPERTKAESGWATGVAAWNALYQNDNDLVEKVSDWMGAEKLKTGYTLEVERFRELPLGSDLMIAFQNNTVIDDIDDTAAELQKYPIRNRVILAEVRTGLKLRPSDIGIGISQIVPVVIAAIESENRVIAVEQPELHLHPAVQAELGDLFIHSAVGNYPRELGRPLSLNVCLIETHSEHLILRILRRIRETSVRKSSNGGPSVLPSDLTLIYVGNDERSGKANFLNLRVDERGRIVDRVPGGFFEEDFAEVF